METSFLAYIHIVFVLENLNTIVRCPLVKFIQTKLQLTFDDAHVERSAANLKIIDINREINTIGSTVW